MSNLEIVRVEDDRGRREFVSFPYELYRSYPNWVPPLRLAQKELFDPSKHPFHLHGTVQLFLARRAGKTVGRIAAILDPRFGEFHDEKAGFFGFLELIDDASVASALLGTARDWLKQNGAEVLRGPVNPSTNYECGVLVDGFDLKPSIMMTYNPPYYGPLIEQAGLAGVKDLVAYDLPIPKTKRDRVQSLTDRAKASGMVVRGLRMSEFDQEVERVWDIYNSAWERNWGFVPMSREEFFFHGHEMKQILVPELAIFAEIGGKPAGFALAVPDINQALQHVTDGRLLPLGLLRLLWYKRKVKWLRVVLLGVLPEFRTTLAAAGLYAALISEAERLGFGGAECSWVLDDNVLMRRAIESLGGVVSKTYRIYGWK